MTTASVTLATLQETVARGLARFPAERSRIERAATLIALGSVEQIGPTSHAVRSKTAAGLTYTVTPSGCPCQDAQRHADLSCKHQWAVDLLQAADERQRRQDTRERRHAARSAISVGQVALAFAAAHRAA